MRTSFRKTGQPPFRVVLYLTAFLSLLFFSQAAHAATSCSPGLSSVLGIEYVASQCPGESSTFNYYGTELECITGTVQRNPLSSGDTYYQGVTPQAMHNWLLNNAQAYNMKYFRDSGGTRFVLVHRYFAQGGKIDGKAMNGYPFPPGVNTDVFDKVLYKNPNAVVPCCLRITGFAATPPGFDPAAGESTTLAGAIYANFPIDWTLAVHDRTTSGTGSSASFGWDGKDASGHIVPGGNYAASLTAHTNEGNCTDTKTAQVTVASPCDLAVTPEPKILNPYTGGEVAVSATITGSSGRPVTWELTLPNGDTVNGEGATVSAKWDGKINGKLEAGKYKATVYAQISAACSVNGEIPIEIVQPEKRCTEGSGFEVTIGSSAHVANGNLAHSQELFSSRGGALPVGMTLYYNSLDPHGDSLGTGWSHDYDISLKLYDDGSILLKEGNWKRRLYLAVGAAYHPLPDNHSTLVKNLDGSFVLTHKDGLKYNFRPDGKLGAIADRNSNTVSFAYSGGRLTGITDPGGRTATISRDSAGLITAITDARGNGYTFTYAGSSLASVTYPDGGTWQYTYDDKAFLLSKTDPLGHTTQYTYDDNHRVAAATGPDGKTRTIAYPSGTDTERTSVFTEKDGGVWQYTYDVAKDTLIRKTDPVGGVTSYTYDGKRNLLGATGPGGATTSYAYDAEDNLVSMTDPLGAVTTFTYNDFGQVLTVTDPKGHTLTNTYDAAGNLTQTTDAKGAKTVFTHDDRGNLLTVTDPRNKTITYAYDAAGNLLSVTDQNNKVTTFTWDANGNPLTETSPAGKTTTYEYDARNRLVAVTDPLGYVTRLTYDALGNMLTITDANGRTTTYSYNHNGRVQTVKDALGNVTAITYSGSCGSCGQGGDDNLLSVTDANGNITRYEYDPRGWLVKEIDPIGRITTYSYNPDGTIAERTDANGRTTTYSYDAAKRLLSRTYHDGTRDTFTYDPAGNLLTAANGQIGYTMSYDVNNRLTAVRDNKGRTIKYTLNANGYRTKMTAPDGRITTYGYDAKNRLTKLVDNGATYTFAYNALDARTRITNANGTYTTFGYDAGRRLTKLATYTSAAAILDSITHAYDKTVNRTKKTEPSGITRYSYDPVYRLTKTVLGTATREQYGYDAAGNRLTGPQAGTAHTIGPGNQLTSTSTALFTYDNNGNIITKTEGGTTFTFGYDGENRLVTAENGTTTAGYAYDPFGRRIAKTVNGVTTNYLYDGANILYEYDGSNNITARYTHTTAVDDPLAVEIDGAVYTYHKDTLGSVRTITDNAQTPVATYSYDSFGNMTRTGTLNQPYTYTGREWDPETGLYYYRARYYDPTIGRFISRDPISFAGGDVNLYGYVQNNPVNKKDPFGLWDSKGFPANLGNYANSAPYWPGSDYKPIGPFGKICGAEGTVEATWIPDITPEACRKHDECYDECAKKCAGYDCKNKCDWQLFRSNPPYGTATRLYGKEAYDAAKRKYSCDKCKK